MTSPSPRASPEAAARHRRLGWALRLRDVTGHVIKSYAEKETMDWREIFGYFRHYCYNELLPC